MEKRVLKDRSAGVLTFVLSYTFSKSFEANHRLNDWNFAEPLIHELDNNDKTAEFLRSAEFGISRWARDAGCSRNSNKAVDAVFRGLVVRLDLHLCFRVSGGQGGC